MQTTQKGGVKQPKRATYKQLKAQVDDIYYCLKKSDRLLFEDDGKPMSCDWNGAIISIHKLEAMIIALGSRHIYNAGTLPYKILQLFVNIERGKLKFDDEQIANNWYDLGERLIFAVCAVGGMVRIHENKDAGGTVKEGLHRVVNAILQYNDEVFAEGENAEPITAEEELEARDIVQLTITAEQGVEQFIDLSNNKETTEEEEAHTNV